MSVGPQRIVCLTEEPTEILCALGESDRIVGISAYTVRPPGIAQEKPVVSAYLDGSVTKIAALKPDLIIGFSDIQADLAAKLIRAHLPVLIFNQRSVSEILDVIGHVGRLVGASDKTEILLTQYQENLRVARAQADTFKAKPRVYFEEWDEPMITGIEWVSELITMAGGIDIFPERAISKGAGGRTVLPTDVIRANPDIIIASWCGKPVQTEAIEARPGFSEVTAVRQSHIYELDPSIILQPGPAALTDGLQAIRGIVDSWQKQR